MKKFLLPFVAILFVSAASLAQGTVEAYNVSVLAGRSTAPMMLDGIGEDARFQAITAMWGDGANLYVADSMALRRIELNTARVTTVSRTAGSGLHRRNAGSGFQYDYAGLNGLWSDGLSLYAADIGAGSIRRIDLKTGGVRTVAEGLGFAWGLSGRGTSLYVASAQTGRVMQVDSATGATAELAITGSGTPRECFLGSGCIGYFVPGPRSAWSDGQALFLTGYSGTVNRLDLASGEQTFLSPAPFNIGPIAGASDRLFVAGTTMSQLGSVRLATGEFTPIAVPSDNLIISALWSDSVSLYIAQGFGFYLGAQVIRRIDLATGLVTTVAGVAQVPDFANGVGAAARFQSPRGIWGVGDTLYVADRGDFTIRKVDAKDGTVTTFAGAPGTAGLQDGVGTNANFIAPVGLWSDGATLYVTDGNSIRSLNLNSAEVTTIAGGATPGARDGIGAEAQLSSPSGLWGQNGVLYIADTNNEVIRQVNMATKEVTTLAGAFGVSANIDGPLATARFRAPKSLSGDGATLYVDDLYFVRAISLQTGMVRTVAAAQAGAQFQGIWASGGSLYTFVLRDAASSRWNPYRIDLDTGEMSQLVYGTSEPDAGSPVSFPGAGPIWGENRGLFMTADNAVWRLTRETPAPTSAKLEIANPGYSSQVTTGGPSVVSIAHARINVNSGSVTPAGFAVFAFRQNGVLISEASVPAAHAIRSGRVVASAAGVVNTGIAIANPNPVSAAISFYFTDATGRNYREGAFTLAAGAQVARFLTQEPFNGQAPIDGTFSFVASVPVSAVALRGYVNERSEFLMTTLPVVDLSLQSNAPATIPHFAAGGGWSTELALMNPSDQPISGALQFLGGTITGAPSTYAIAARASQRIRLEGPAATITTGGIRVMPQIGVAPSAVCIFSFVTNGIRVTEASVPDVPAASSFHLYAETTDAFLTASPGSARSGLAVTNTSATAGDVIVELSDMQGARLPVTGTLHVDGMSHVSLFLDEIPILKVAPGFAGTHFVRVSSANAAISVAGLRGRYNERGDFLITTTPAIPEDTSPDTRPLYIAHVVNGGGYTTQFVLFGATAQSAGTGVSVTTEYFTQAGEPMLAPIR